MSEKPFIKAYAGQLRVELPPYTFSRSEALELARELQDAAYRIDELPSIHEGHVDLLASCPLCVYEANGQTDRLTYDEDQPAVKKDLTDAQRRVVEKTIRLTDITGDAERLEYDLDLALEELEAEHRQFERKYSTPGSVDDVTVITPERFLQLATGKWVVAEMKPKNGRKRTVRGDIVAVNDWPPVVYERGDRKLGKVISVVVRDKAGRDNILDVEHIDRLITGGENGITLVLDGELALDYRLARR